MRAVAVPLCLSDGTATAAITAVGTKSQLTKAKILECSEDLRAVGREVSGRFARASPPGRTTTLQTGVTILTGPMATTSRARQRLSWCRP